MQLQRHFLVFSRSNKSSIVIKSDATQRYMKFMTLKSSDDTKITQSSNYASTSTLRPTCNKTLKKIKKKLRKSLQFKKKCISLHSLTRNKHTKMMVP